MNECKFELSPLQQACGAVALTAVNSDYSSVSNIGGRLTGSRYQTIEFEGEVFSGFRSNRDDILDRLDFSGMTVLDVGSNYGEITRSVAQRDATLVVGVEYDRVFSSIAQLLTLAKGVDNAVHICGDMTSITLNSFGFNAVMCFSAWPFVQSRIAELHDSGAKVFLLETHELPDDEHLMHYFDVLLPYFPVYTILGSTPHGDSPKGQRLVVAFAINYSELHDFVRLDSDLRLFGDFFDGVYADQVERDSSERIGSRTYWEKFVLGQAQWKKSGEITIGNAHLRNLDQRLLAEIEDPYLGQVPLEKLAFLLAARFTDFQRIQESGTAGIMPVVRYRDASSARELGVGMEMDWPCEMDDWVDGWHRLFSAWFAGCSKIPVVYVLKERPLSIEDLSVD